MHSPTASPTPLPAAAALDARKARARAWFEALRDDICAAFERLEDEAPAALYGERPGRFVRTPWSRTDHTGAAEQASLDPPCVRGLTRTGLPQKPARCE